MFTTSVFFLLFLKTCFSQSILARFVNLSREPRSIWWIHPGRTEIRFFGTLEGDGGTTAFTTYEQHEFYWCHPGKQKEEQLNKFIIQRDKNLYWFEDETTSKTLLAKLQREVNYLNNYYKTNGKHWLSPMSRAAFPPRLRRRDPNIKSTTVSTRFSRVLCENYEHSESCLEGRTSDLVLEAVSQSPAVFRVKDFISQFEADAILRMADGRFVRSMVGDGDDSRHDSTRTSTNTWLAMNATKIIERIYGRIGDIVGADPKYMTKEATIDHEHGIASHMEVVRFEQGQEYAPHYDNAPGKVVNLRYITFQVTLRTSNNFQGGATGFPKANGGRGYSEPSETRSAVFWYNMLEDGNLDDAALYTNEPVRSGEQFLFHVIVWDPNLPRDGDPRMDHKKVYSLHDEL